MAEVNQQQVIDYIKGISVMELSQLVKALESELGVSAAAAMPMAMPGAAAGGGAAPAPAEEETGFNVNLVEAGGGKIKGLTVGATRTEYEYEIPMADCNAMLDTLAERPLIEKKRYKVQFGGLTWEIDEFFGENTGLIVAEIELKSEDQTFKKPDWVGDEVTGDPRYFNANLIKQPYTQW